MNSPEIERVVAEALQSDAEDAMSRTDTTEQLQSFYEASRRRDERGRRRLRVAGALAAGVAVAAVAVVFSLPGGDGGTAPPVGPPTKVERVTEAEQVAGDFIRSLAGFDRNRAATYVAPGARLGLGNVMGNDTYDDAWRLRNRWDEATGWKVVDVAGCHETSVRTSGIDVRCVFSAHQLGSDQLGRGPFGGNVLAVTVRDGMLVVDARLTTAHDTSGFSDTMWDPFWAWMGRTHPNDESRMAAFEKPHASAARVTSSLRLWHRRVQQYVEAVQAGTAR